MKKKWIALLLALVLAFSAGIPVFAAPAQEMPTISSAGLNLKPGDSAQLTSTLGGADVTYGMLWTSDAPAVATVSHGTVQAVSPGTATVTATTGDGRGARCTVRVGILGIDVSHYQNDQGAVFWGDVKNSGVSFALLRTGYGDELPEIQTDPSFVSNYAGAVAAGLKVGVYHLSYATTPAEAVLEANFCLTILSGRPLQYPVFYDLEPTEEPAQAAMTADQLSAIAAAFCSTVTAAGYKAGVYSTDQLMSEKLNGPALAAYDKWVAHPDVNSPSYPGAYTLWQYSQTGSLPGITGAVDLDYSYRDYPNPAPQAADISLLSDSPASITLQKGKAYQFKFTPNGISGVPSFQSGNSGVLKVSSQKTAGGCYYVKITATGSGCTSLYSLLPGQQGVRRCLITVS